MPARPATSPIVISGDSSIFPEGLTSSPLQGLPTLLAQYADDVAQNADLSPLFKGLPNDECQCEHMGYVMKGKLAFRSGDQEVVVEAGDAYFVGPGHTPVLYAGTEVVEFSPTEELAKTMEVVTQNMEG